MLAFTPTTLAAFAALLSVIRAAPIIPSTLSKRATSATIRPTDNNNVCLGVSNLSNGALVIEVACTQRGGLFNRWDISPGDNEVVRLSGLPADSGDWCLDAGLDFTSGKENELKIWQCYPGLPQQRWWYTDDAHLAVTDGNACVTNRRGSSDVFTEGCFSAGGGDHGGGNPYIQTFDIVEDGPSTPPVSEATGTTIRPTNNATACLGVSELSNGALLSAQTCTEGSGFYNQWDIKPGDNEVVRLTGLPEGSGDWCLDAGLDFTSGNDNDLKIWQCFPGLPQQRWWYTNDAHLAVTDGNACVTNYRGSSAVFTEGCFTAGGGDHGGGNPFIQTFNLVESSPASPSVGTGTTLRPTNNGTACLGVSELSNGALLSAQTCTEGSGFYNQWDIKPGDNEVVRLTGLPEGSGDWCLDAGLDFTSGNDNDLKIWQCFPGLPQQRWWYTDDAHLAVTDGNACVTNYRGSSAVFTEGCFTAGGGDHGGGNPFIQTFNIVEAGAI
ncbi:hypothetical protein QFC24_005424 [Naganishia onofrii]|uniref:Uncharacterized protein n=1 Tax=Naganishia onofrii TaxID=1851511 RepID=A0ACC2X928_9TREE|nr:hypothetical protein QFC24_005424 [Naganishia onofrii]